MQRPPLIVMVALFWAAGTLAVPAFAAAHGPDTTRIRLINGRRTGERRAVGDSTPTPATSVSAGSSSTCAVIGGGVKCWGFNFDGQLGDGTRIPHSVPADVASLTTGVTAVSAGAFHVCALTAAGGVKCWGSNFHGQLGDGSTTTQLAPVDVAGMSTGIAAIASGSNHTCALTTAGAVKCWGSNSSGELGDGTGTDRSAPVAVAGLTSGVAALAAGFDHTCALTTGGGVKCWGANTNGQIGDATTTQRLTPTDVSGLTSGVVAIGAGYRHSCAVMSTGGVQCWGYNNLGQLGEGTTSDASSPVSVAGFIGQATALALGYYHTCALAADGSVSCWGRDQWGELGDATTADRGTPARVAGLASGVAAIASGPSGYHTCALTSAGGFQCWGSDSYGQLGDGSTGIRSVPVDVPLLSSAVKLGSGFSSSCALTASGGVRCWGHNGAAQLGNGTNTSSSSPVDVNGLSTGVSDLGVGVDHVCAVTTGGAVTCWGSNSHGQLGDGSIINGGTPVNVTGLGSGAAAVAAGHWHTCALTSTGGVKCWGDNEYGQVGDGTSSTTRPTPVDVSGLTSGVTAIAAGYDHTCALTSAGGVKCWGYNESGQLGDGTTTAQATPVDVSGLTSGVLAITAGYHHSCAVTAAGGLKCWGYNNHGQLGDGTTTAHAVPVDVSGLTTGVSAVVGGYYHTCAILGGGALKCWGYNAYSQLGNGTNTNQTSPADVSGLTSGVSAVAPGGNHTCALLAGGGMKCWGSDADGQLALGRSTWSTVPVDVVGFGKTTATVSLASLTHTYNATPWPVAVTTTPSGLSVTVTYSGTSATAYAASTTPPTGAGTYFVSAVINDATYQGSANATLVVARASGTVTLGSLAQVYTGAPGRATATTDPAGLAVTFLYTGTGSTIYGPTATPPTDIGTYSVTATIADPNYQGSASGAMTIVGGPPVITTQPVAQTVSAGTVATFTAAATGAPTPTVQWQASADGGSTYAGIGGATATSYAFTATVADNNKRFRAVFSNASGSTTTSGATLRVRGDASVTPATLRFGADKSGSAGAIVHVTPAQAVTVTFTGAPSAWTATSDVSWLQVTGGSGTTNGQFTVAIVNPGNVIGGSTTLSGTVTLSAPTSPTASLTIPVTLTVYAVQATDLPFGQVDTPIQNATSIAGSIGVTGWALDDVGVTSVQLYRDCLSFEPAADCQTIGGARVVYMGDADLVPDARPDVEATYPSYPQAYRGGWGYLLLTNMLPHIPNQLMYGGQGSLSIYVLVTDVEDHSTWLGRTIYDQTPTTIMMDNDAAAKPFGAIDTPGQGQTVSGGLWNFGWALTPDTNTTADAGDILVPTSGSTAVVWIDGAPAGNVTYNLCRGTVGSPVPAGAYCNDDVANIFGNPTPQATYTARDGNATRYRNLDADRGAIGAYHLDTTMLSNGRHSIVWSVTDSAGRVDGIGSRFFTVLNGGSSALLTGQDKSGVAPASTLATLQAAPAPSRGDARVLDQIGLSWADVPARVSFDSRQPLQWLAPDENGVRHVQVAQLSRLELQLGPGLTAAYLAANGTLRDLPPGSHLDPVTGVFTWMPVPGYLGTYRLAFLRGEEQALFDVTVGELPVRPPPPRTERPRR